MKLHLKVLIITAMLVPMIYAGCDLDEKKNNNSQIISLLLLMASTNNGYIEATVGGVSMTFKSEGFVDASSDYWQQHASSGAHQFVIVLMSHNAVGTYNGDDGVGFSYVDDTGTTWYMKNNDDISLTITLWEDKGGMAMGSFSGTLTQWLGTATQYTSGVFIIRILD